MTQVGNHKRLSIHRGWKIQRRNVDTLQGTNISHLGKRKIIFKMPFLRDMLVSWRVYFLIFHRDLQLCLFSDLEQLEQPTFLICKECPNLTSVGSNQKPFKKKVIHRAYSTLTVLVLLERFHLHMSTGFGWVTQPFPI